MSMDRLSEKLCSRICMDEDWRGWGEAHQRWRFFSLAACEVETVQDCATKKAIAHCDNITLSWEIFNVYFDANLRKWVGTNKCGPVLLGRMAGPILLAWHSRCIAAGRM